MYSCLGYPGPRKPCLMPAKDILLKAKISRACYCIYYLNPGVA
nr:MAG TPA: hypothetical protein [Caudoviricetes sp.]